MQITGFVIALAGFVTIVIGKVLSKHDRDPNPDPDFEP